MGKCRPKGTVDENGDLGSELFKRGLGALNVTSQTVGHLEF